MAPPACWVAPRCGNYVIVSHLIAVSSWALHRTIGAQVPDSPAHGRGAVDSFGPSPTSLTALPAELAQRGYTAMQLCHFHLLDRSPDYVAELRAALDQAEVYLHALLIDDGDISHPETGARDAEWIAGWLDVAEQLGASHARVIAGKQPTTPETLTRAIEHLRHLIPGRRVRLQVENWFDLLATPEAVHELLDALDGQVGLCADFGNWPRPRKYEDLPKIMGRAESCHAKLEFAAPGVIDEADAAAMIGIADAAGFNGPYVIVNGGSLPSEWEAIAIQRDRLSPR